ncbi:hypothetical protein L3Q82_022151 [Scortum barcoo]|uniref:Uncharacterized protein n=1 Tax=Scortum barcoo TaxID=214431 RepID=A0ACB8X109_9TELE|nr:hypothetical protein L3Q82_022151 [Scortum barcoo]
MTVWWCALILLCSILNCVESSAPSLFLQRSKYNNSFRLTRSTRTRVQLLQKKYDWERLHAAFWDMQAYWNMLEWKRKQLEREETEEREQMAGRTVRTTLPQRMRHVQLDLRDLMSQVSSQMSQMRSSWVKPTSPRARFPLNPDTGSRTVWDRRVDGYIILRDLDLYLTKLARDFLLLASKTHVTQQ